MRIEFAEDVILQPECWHHLDRILCSVEDGWHEWRIEDPDFLEYSEWLKGSRHVFRELFEKATIQNVYPVANKLHSRTWIVSCNSTDDTLPPRSAACFFTQPLKILVENRYTDCCFLEAVLRYLSSENLLEFVDQCQNHPWVCDSVGGTGQLPRLIDGHAREMVEDGLPPHAVVLTDSDARFPGDISDTARKIAETCKQHDIPYLVLSKRAIENYIPNQVLQDWAAELDHEAERPRIEVICRLTKEQRDHLAMKKQFNPKKLNAEEQDVYATISDADTRILRKPNKLGNDLIESLKTHNENLTAEALRQRDGNGELDTLVTMIKEAL